jgi:divalent metal cation (Fe/Co/Zn/Cd) transporter
MGESLPKEDEQPLRDLIRNSDGVVHVDQFSTVYFGPEKALLSADVSFDSAMDTETIDERITSIENAVMERAPQVKRVYIEPEI